MDRGLSVQSFAGDILGAAHHAGEEEGGDLLRLALLELVAAGEGEKGGAGLRDGGEEGAELGPSTTLRINSLG